MSLVHGLLSLSPGDQGSKDQLLALLTLSKCHAEHVCPQQLSCRMHAAQQVQCRMMLARMRVAQKLLPTSSSATDTTGVEDCNL
eukprot:1156781-Pelagomonas_calceolata.AAC.4